jgi:hypothetical protein
MKQLLLKSKKSNLPFSITEKKQVKKSNISISINWLKCLFVVLLLNPFLEVIAQYNSVICSSLPINSVATVTSIAGSGEAINANGTRTDSSFGFPSSITTKASGYVFIPDFGNNLICVIMSAGVVSIFPESRMAGNSKYYRVINK